MRKESFLPQQIGKATINTPTVQKDRAQQQIKKDERELEQGEIKK